MASAAERSAPPHRAASWRAWLGGHLGHLLIGALVVAMRLRFLWTPITSDEGGYLSVARYWSRGATLYREAWVDRPQGLLLLYRALHVVGLGTTVGVRLLAIAAALLGTAACAHIAGTLAGRRAVLPAALLTGVLLSVPQYEGFIANAELLSGAIGATGLAMVLAAVWRAPARRAAWLAGAGAVSGFALLVKQSAFDTVAAAGVVLILQAVTRRPGAVRRLAAYAGGVAVMLGLAALHGALTGWSRWWFAVAGYRLGHRSVLETADWAKFRETFGIVRPIVGPAVVLGIVAAVAARRTLAARGLAVLGAWLAAAVVAFLAGGLFHRHYWVLLMFPLGAALGVAVSALRRPPWAPLAVAGLMVLVPLLETVSAVRLPRDRVGPELSGDGRFAADAAVADWVRQHRTDSSQAVYAMCASAGLYGDIDSNAPYPYLWFLNIQDIPGAIQQLADLLAGPSAPTFVAVYQSPDACDRSGRVGAALAANYHRVDTVLGVAMLRHT